MQKSIFILVLVAVLGVATIPIGQVSVGNDDKE